MTLAWALLAGAAACWPTSPRAGRLVALSAAGRLLGQPGPAPSRLRLIRPPGWVLAVAGCVGLGGGVGLAHGRSAGLAVALAAVVPAAVLVHVLAAVARDRAASRARDSLHLALTVLCGELAAGSTQPGALASAAAAVPEHAAELRALGDVRGGSAQTAPLAAAWQLAAESGAPLAEVLERVRADLDGTRALHRAVAAAVAAAQASAGLLALLPLLGLALGAAIGAHPLSVLLDTPSGRILLVLGGLLDGLGVLWSSTIVRRARP